MGNTWGGQMLPKDFCLDWNDEEIKNAVSDFVFGSNSTQPTQTKKAAKIGKIITKVLNHKLSIIVVEGSLRKRLSANKQIGMLRIAGQAFSRDVWEGTDG